MKTKMQAVKLVTVLAAFFAVALFPINSYASHSWNGYHWARTGNPFTLTVVDSNTSDWQSYFNTSNSDWTSSTVLNLSAVQGDESSTARKRCVMITGKIHSCNAAYGSTGWLGESSACCECRSKTAHHPASSVSVLPQPENAFCLGPAR